MPTKFPRVNVTVTEEQHALLLELAKLQGGSAAGFLRSQLDATTPLLRAVVPMLRRAAEETAISREEATRLLREPLQRIKEMGLDKQLEMLNEYAVAADEECNAASGSERGHEEEDAGAFFEQIDNG